VWGVGTGRQEVVGRTQQGVRTSGRQHLSRRVFSPGNNASMGTSRKCQGGVAMCRGEWRVWQCRKKKKEQCGSRKMRQPGSMKQGRRADIR